VADKNQRNRIDNDAGEAVGNGVGAFTGDTMASALDPFGSVAGAVAGRALDNKVGKGADETNDSVTNRVD
jgi:outer membrane lipoprotein SlyB